jgi:3-phenylpropionate/cinnamic acid dioxygenase small subunit
LAFDFAESGWRGLSRIGGGSGMSGTTDGRQACADLVAAFAHYVDHREFGKAVAVFAADAVFARHGGVANGTDEIAAIWADRPETVVTKHLCGVPVFIEVEDDRITAVTPFTLYTLQHEGEGLPTFDKPAAIAEFRDEFRRTDTGWKIARREGVPLMVAAP